VSAGRDRENRPGLRKACPFLRAARAVPPRVINNLHGGTSVASVPGMMSPEKTPAVALTMPVPPPSVLVRYSTLVVLVVVALATVIARESWVAWHAEDQASLRSALLVTGLAAAGLPLALAAWLAVLAGMRRKLRDHERSGAALRDSEARHRAMFEGNPLAMWLYDLDTLAILAVNEGAVRQYGYPRDEFLRMSLHDLHTAETRPSLLGRVEELRAGVGSDTYATQHQRRDGTAIDVEICGSTVRFEGRCARLVTSVDVTERQRLEAQLRQAQKMDAVGQLAGGVAHDFNNILNVIAGYAEMALRGTEPARQKTYLGEVLKASERAAALTRQLLTFSRQQVVQPQVLDLNAVVADMEMMLRRLIGPRVELSTAAAAGLGRVKADPGQVGQVILNLTVNARDAMPEGGPLLIETADVELDEEYARRHPGVAAGSYVMLAVSDAGLGMPPEVQQRVFEPFFTTKEKDKGTGLGLSTVYGIVKQCGGSIGLYSEVGKGTCFKVYFPRVDAEAARSAGAALPVPLAPPGGTVLLVEDEPGVRTLTREMLESAGFDVLEAADSAAALEQAVGAAAIDVVLTDVMMPQMDGRELARRLEQIRPGLNVVYMSGYTAQAIARQGALREGVPFLEKPFTSASLILKLREALGGQGAAGAA
jgi:two-component system cell cycle sensor histidine kinase/response regulator CckA